MTREEVLEVAKPIIFNTEMVRAILDGRKTVTRRVVKLKYSNTHLEMFTNKYGTRLIEIENAIDLAHIISNPDGTTTRKLRAYIEKEPTYKPGDILYVRETWDYIPESDTDGFYVYATDRENPADWKWRPSIHMPKEAARIFLRVTNVRVERLQDIMKAPPGPNNPVVREGFRYGCDFVAAWDKTIKPKDRALYGWDANPWVWVIEFERIETDDEL